MMDTLVWISLSLSLVVVNVHDYPVMLPQNPVRRWICPPGIIRLIVSGLLICKFQGVGCLSWHYTISLTTSFGFIHHSIQTISLSLSLSLVTPHAIVVMSNVAWNNTVNVARNPHWNKSLVYNSPLSLSLSLSLPASISNSKVYSSSHPVSRLFAALHCSFTFASVRTLPSSCLIQMLASLYMMASGEITRK